MDWSQCPDAESVPGKVSGAWVVKGTRVQADAIVENAGEGFTAEEIATEIFAGVPVERIRGVLAFAASCGAGDLARPKPVGLNHVALEVGSVADALAFYGAIFTLTLRGQGEGAAFVDLGDQFLALMEGPVRQPEGARHFGLVVDDRAGLRALAEAAGARMVDDNSFLDPWGNRVEVVAYRDVQFTKTDAVARGLGLDPGKTPAAVGQLRDKGLAPEGS